MDPYEVARQAALLEAELHLGRDLEGVTAVSSPDDRGVWLLLGDDLEATLWVDDGVLIYEDDPSGRVKWCEWWQQGELVRRMPIETG